MLPAVHSLTGCDYCSKFGTKLSSLKASPETYLKDFGTMNDIEKQIALSEEHLVKVVKKPSTFKATDRLRDYLYHHAKCQYLTPTSYAIRMHILRAFYATNLMTNILFKTSKSLDPTLFGFEVVSDLLVLQFGNNPIPEEFTITCNCSKCVLRPCPGPTGYYTLLY